MHPVKYSNNFSQLTSVYKQYQESDKLIISIPVKPVHQRKVLDDNYMLSDIIIK